MNASEFVKAHKNDNRLDLTGRDKGDNKALIGKTLTIDQASRVENGGAPYYIVFFKEQPKQFYFSFSTLTQYLEDMHEHADVWESVNDGGLPSFTVSSKTSKTGREYLSFEFKE